jgi:D-alanyl-D-alanine dipeptidase
MKNLTQVLLIAVLALCSVAAYAGDKQSIDLNVHEAAVIAGVKVPAGEYKMLIERDGQSVKFTLMQGHRTVVSTGAQFVELSSFSAPTAIETGAGEQVRQIQVAKLKGAIVFSPGTGSAAGN